MTTRHTLKLTSDGETAHLELDGHDLTNSVRSLHITPNGSVELDVVVLLADVQIGDTVIDIPAPTRQTLVLLGWTPPHQHVDTCNRSHHDVLSDTAVHCDQPTGHGGPHQAPTPDHARTTWNEPPIITDDEPMRA